MKHIDEARRIAKRTDLKPGFGRPFEHEVAEAQLHALIAIHDVLMAANYGTPIPDIRPSMDRKDASDVNAAVEHLTGRTNA